jgi:hypothetical protein
MKKIVNDTIKTFERTNAFHRSLPHAPLTQRPYPRISMLAASFPPCVVMPIRPPHFVSSPPGPPQRHAPSTAASSAGPSLPFPPPSRYLLAVASSLATTASAKLAGRGCLHRASEPSRRMLQQAGEGGQDSCDAAPVGELPVPLPHTRSNTKVLRLDSFIF